MGSVAENVFSRNEDILESLKKTNNELDVDKSLFGKFIGTGGVTVHRLEKEHDVLIHLENKDGKVYIVGEKDQAEAVKDTIISIISGEHNSQEIKNIDAVISAT